MYCALSSVISDFFFLSGHFAVYMHIYNFWGMSVWYYGAKCSGFVFLYTRSIDLRMWRKYFLVVGLEIILS